MILAKNVNRVEKKVWRGWSEDAQRVFNDVYAFMLENMDIMLHPKQDTPKASHWKTTAWNAAWIAADAVDGVLPDDVVEI